MDDTDRTASLLTPSKLAQVSQPRVPVSPAVWLNPTAGDDQALALSVGHR